jgi:DNA-binding Lrp family transcriptional regulator
MTANFDDTDMKVLEVLKENSRATVRYISKKINMPITTVHNRVKKLKKEGIKKFTIEPDYERLGKGILVTVYASIDHEKLVQGESGIENLKKKLRGFAEIEKIYTVTGDIDLILLVRVANIKELDEFLVKKLRNIKGVQKTTTQIVLEED